jgi:hypothetical protein
LNGQSFSVGSGGEVFENYAFVNIAGEDLNGGDFGTSAQLSIHSLPTGLDFAFSTSLSADATDLVLTYEFTNNTGADIADITFISFLDVEIDESINTFFNELASTSGALAPGQGFEADEPGFLFGDIYDNALLGTLDNTNSFPPADDVSMALSFEKALLGADEVWSAEIMISEDGDIIFPGAFALTQTDADPGSTTEITYSGRAVAQVDPDPTVPEPSAALVFGVGALIVGSSLRRRSFAQPSKEERSGAESTCGRRGASAD